ncbi:MAG: sigma-54-dependent transcriptional regulator [Bradymonadaceae bacterium]
MSKILVIEDNDTLREGVVQVLTRMDHEVFAASGGREGLELFLEHEPDLVITDLKMDDIDGMEVLAQIVEKNDEALVIIITAFGSIEKAVEAMQRGAFDFIPKPFPPDLLRAKVEKALGVGKARVRTERLERENELLRKEVAGDFDHEMVGNSVPMQKIFSKISKIAPTDSTVYIYGESGTGKELIARAIHEASSRASGPFVKVNCSSLAETLLESELFGHEKGAFTGAHKKRIGRFELADEGTLFLDEIGDVSPSIQLKLLRVIQEREFERVGGERTVKVDVRVVTATNKDLKEEVAAGRFREDLFYRLHIIPIDLPPLRDRPEDVLPLMEHFIAKLGKRTRSEVKGAAPDALQALQRYGWPGNVRELENVIEHALVFADGEYIELGDLPAQLTGRRSENLLQLPAGECSLPDILEDLEKQLILRAYGQAQGVKTETARLLGIKSSALYYKLEKYGIDEPEEEEVH